MHCVKAFQETPGPVRVFDIAAKPLELFQLFYTGEIFRHIVQWTNDNAHRKRTADPESYKCTWTPVDVNDINTYYGVLIMCDILKLDRGELYFKASTEKHFMLGTNLPIAKDIFFTIRRYLHFSMDGEPGNCSK